MCLVTDSNTINNCADFSNLYQLPYSMLSFTYIVAIQYLYVHTISTYYAAVQYLHHQLSSNFSPRNLCTVSVLEATVAYATFICTFYYYYYYYYHYLFPTFVQILHREPTFSLCPLHSP